MPEFAPNPVLKKNTSLELNDITKNIKEQELGN
jgi:hypothetical protein